LGLARLREKFGPKMTDGSDRIAFDAASRPAAATSEEFVQIARMAASVDTLDGFLREMKARFPEGMRQSPQGVLDPATTGSLPRARGIASR
jgi:hypothetical protein